MNDDKYTAVVTTVLVEHLDSLENVIQGTSVYRRPTKGWHIECLLPWTRV